MCQIYHAVADQGVIFFLTNFLQGAVGRGISTLSTLPPDLRRGSVNFQSRRESQKVLRFKLGEQESVWEKQNRYK